jgi:thioredoxin reductase (NADPH)
LSVDFPHDLELLELELVKRYGEDYQVVCTSGLADALGALDEFAESSTEVALVLADFGEAEVQVLAHARARHKALLDQLGRPRLPVVVTFDGRVLEDPTNAEIAGALGVRTRPPSASYDVIVIGAGPAGLAAAVYAASEGLRTLLLEREAIGGQAGTSSSIRNYLGFPRGISGTELAVRAFEQAGIFGSDIVYGEAVGVEEQAQDYVVKLRDGGTVRSRAVVVATGVSYRRLGIPALDAYTGSGLFYGAAASEAKAMQGRPVHVVGGANSAGQAALHLAGHAAHVTLVVRRSNLTETISDYPSGRSRPLRT